MRIITRILATIGLLVVISTVISIATFLLATPKTEPVPAQAVLTFDFRNVLAENPENNILSAAMGGQTGTFRHFIQALDRARRDDQIAGLLLIVSDLNLNTAQIEEARAAIKRFNESGKFSYAWADSYGEMGPGNRAYWLASATQKILMQPLGTLGITGSAVSLPFARTALDRLGIIPDMHARYEYKGAADNLTEKTLPAPLRENYTRLLTDLNDTMVGDIAADRGLKAPALKKLMDNAPLSSKEALDAKLIDKLAYADEITPLIQTEHQIEAKAYGLLDYLYQSEAPSGTPEANIALIYLTGAIVRHDDSPGPMGEQETASADTIAQALTAAANNDDVDAIILRIDSPGGSVTASETIRRAVVKAREKGKYVVVSMAGTAASGGYWVASAADRIFALPSTMTGSIGVVGGKIVFGPLAEKLGVSWSEFGTNANSTMWSAATPFSGGALKRVNQNLDDIYQAFIDRVAEGRKLTPAQLDKLARGRVWSGASAKELGLVDELGGLRETLIDVRKHLGLAEDALVLVNSYPEPEPGFKRVLKLLRQFISGPQLDPMGLLQLRDSLQASQRSQTLYYAGPRGIE